MMAMADYLAEIEHAAENLISIICEEHGRLRSLEAEITSLTKLTEDNYRRAEFVAMNAEDPDDVAMAAGMHWDNYFGNDKGRYYKDKDQEKLVEQIDAHAFSVGALAGSLLQYARQGISICHGEFAACPNGRTIGSQFLKDVIWEGRNQAIHWEEGNLKSRGQQCFDKLSNEVNSSFGEYNNQNMAIDVVEQLG